MPLPANAGVRHSASFLCDRLEAVARAVATWRCWERKVKHYQDTLLPLDRGSGRPCAAHPRDVFQAGFRLTGENDRGDPVDNPQLIQVNAIPGISR
jgi:hypothetical protein